MNPPPKPLVLIGAGGHALEVAQLVDDINAASAAPLWHLLGCLVERDLPQAGAQPPRGGMPPLLGSLDWLPAHGDTAFVLAIGDSRARSRLMGALPGASHAPVLIHPRAWVASRALLGAGTVVFANAAVNAGASVGAHVILNLGCTVSHDCRVGDACSLGPGSHLAGGVQVEPGCELGAGCVARPRSRIGAMSVVGAGAVVVADLPPGSRAAGVPARQLLRNPQSGDNSPQPP